MNFTGSKLPDSILYALLCALGLGLTLAGPEASGQSRRMPDPVVVMQTTKGTMAIRVFSRMAPTTSRNFLDLVRRGFYDGKTFHRVETWCIQGGCPRGDGLGNYCEPETGQVRTIPLEINRNLSHSSAGVVAMARSNSPNSASCQFYILKQPMRQLDGQYAIFGGVVEGVNVIQQIRKGDRILHAEIANTGEGDNASAEDWRNSGGGTSSGQGSGQNSGQSSGGNSGF